MKPEKCQLFKRKLRYLGHIVSESGLQPDPDKTSAIDNWPKQRTETELRGFLGLAGYYRRFVPMFAQLAAPLHRLLQGTCRKGKSKTRQQPVRMELCEKTCDDAFEALKQKLVNPPILGFPDFTRPYILKVDASLLGLGAVLSQEQEHGKVAHVPLLWLSSGL